MKKIITLFLATGLVASTFAQDAMQPQGSWYLGTADATEIFQLFSNEGMNMSATIGYAVVDNIVVNLGLTTLSETTDVGDSEITISSSTINVGGQYFFGDNFYGGLDVNLTSLDEDNSTNIQLSLGKYIAVKDMWYVSPALNYGMYSTDGYSNSGINMGIRFGARF